VCIRSVLLALLLSGSCFALNDDDLTFADRLSERKYLNLMEIVLTRSLGSAKVVNEKSQVYLAWIEILKRLAEEEKVRAQDRETYLRRAKDLINEWAKVAPKNDRLLAKARVRIGEIEIQRGTTLLEAARQCTDPKEKEAKRLQALEALREAVRSAEETAKQEKAEFDALRKETTSKKLTKEQETENEKATVEMAQARLELARIRLLFARNLLSSNEKEAKERETVLRDAHSDLRDFISDFQEFRVVVLAYQLDGQVLAELGDKQGALASFDSCIEKAKEIDGLESVLASALYEKAKAQLTVAPCEPSEALKTLNELTSRVPDGDLLMSQRVKLLKADIYIAEGKELRAKKKPREEWGAKYEEARKIARAVASAGDEFDYAAGERIAQCVEALGGGETALDTLVVADRLFREKKYAEAIPKYRQALSSAEIPAPKRKEVVLRLATSYHLTGSYLESAAAHRGIAETYADDRESAEKAARLSADAYSKLKKDTQDPALAKFLDSKASEAISFVDTLAGGGEGLGDFKLGLELYRKDRYKEAIGRFEKVRPISRIYDQALYYMAVCYNREYKNAAKSQGSKASAKALAQQSEAYFLKFIEEAKKRNMEDVDEATRAERHDLIGRAVCALSNLYNGEELLNVQQALKVTDGFLDEYPNLADMIPYVIASRIQAQLKTNQREAAKREFEQFQKVRVPDNMKAKYYDAVYRVHLLLIRSITDEMKPYRDQVAALSKRKGELQEQLAKVAESERTAVEKEIKSIEAQIDAVNQKMNPLRDEMLASYEKLFEINPNQDFLVCKWVFSLLCEKGDYAKAIKYGDNAFRANYGNPKYATEVQRLQEQLGDVACSYARKLHDQPREARKYWKYAVDLLKPRADFYQQQYNALPPEQQKWAPESWSVRRNLADALKATGQYADAARLYDSIRASLVESSRGEPNPDWWSAFYNSTECMLLEGRHKDALANIQSMIIRRPHLGGADFKKQFCALLRRIAEEGSAPADVRQSAEESAKQTCGGG